MNYKMVTSNCYYTHTSFTINSALKFVFTRTGAFDEPDVMGKSADETICSQQRTAAELPKLGINIYILWPTPMTAKICHLQGSNSWKIPWRVKLWCTRLTPYGKNGVTWSKDTWNMITCNLINNKHKTVLQITGKTMAFPPAGYQGTPMMQQTAW